MGELSILIVEDDLIQSTRLKIDLSLLGHNTTYVANDGLEALKLIETKKIDLIFCDINMPKMDGIKFLLRLSEIDNSLGVVIVTAVEDDISELTVNICSLLNFKYHTLLRKSDIKSKLLESIDGFHHQIQEERNHQTPPQLTLSDVRCAFLNRNIINHYQPKVLFSNNTLVAVEALARVKHEDLGTLSPISFIECMEENDMMDELFFVVLNNAVKEVAACHYDISVSINMTQGNLEIPNVCDQIIDVCALHDFSHHKLTLELTESHAYQNNPTALATLARLRIHGFKLSIDDFGTGYASLDKLLDLPFTEMKIDRRFITDLPSKPKYQALVKMLLQVANSLEMNTVVEGVEDMATWNILKELGFEQCQGYFTGAPVPLEKLHNCLSKSVVILNNTERLV
ncbi:EAL domain-containing protein [Vibrio splendidus]